MIGTRRDRGAANAIRVAHCVGFYLPETVGGTEVYVRDLTEALSQHSVDSLVVAATDGISESYQWEGTPVLRYPCNWADILEHRPGSSRAGLSKFQKLILKSEPDLFHLHSWTSGAGLRHLEQVVELCIPCVVTMHVPSAVCLRGTMLLNGQQPCDGRIDEQRCGQCWAMSRGLPRPIAFGLSRLPRLMFSGSWLEKMSRRTATMLSARSLVKSVADDLQTMASLCERVVAPSEWVHSALVANAVPAQKVIVSRQAVARSFVDQGLDRQRKSPGRELRIGFVGRLQPYKGVHILLEAVAQIPGDVPIRLSIAGSSTELPYLRRLQAAAAKDKRIEFLGATPHHQLPGFLEQIDILAVPSNYMETGPPRCA